jgi:hypothetical protein
VSDPETYGKVDLHARRYRPWLEERHPERLPKPANGEPTSPALCVAEGCPSPPLIARQWGAGSGEQNVHESQTEQHVATPLGPMHFSCAWRVRREAMFG